MSHVRPLVTLTLVAAAAIGCGSDPAVRPASAGGPQAGGIGRSAAGAAAVRPGEGSLRVDERIAKACDLPAAHFAFDSAQIGIEARGALDAIATCFARGPLKGRKMTVVGHADSRGELEYNFALGQKRAGTVADYIGRRGVDSGKIVTTSKGELEATGEDESGWAKDRRVEILLVD